MQAVRVAFLSEINRASATPAACTTLSERMYLPTVGSPPGIDAISQAVAPSYRRRRPPPDSNALLPRQRTDSRRRPADSSGDVQVPAAVQTSSSARARHGRSFRGQGDENLQGARGWY